jgi:hypothetical protein
VRFLAFRSHWRFAAEFCTPGEGHEKGGVEGEGGYFRRNHLVPVPRVADLDALNAMLLTACRADEARVLDGRSETIGAAMAVERGHLLPCAVEGLDLAETVFPVVDKLRYSQDQFLLRACPRRQPGGSARPSTAHRDLAGRSLNCASRALSQPPPACA